MSHLLWTDAATINSQTVKKKIASPGDERKGKPARAGTTFEILFAAGLCLLTTLPYLVGYLHRSPGRVFSGVLDHSLDTNNYLAYIHQSLSGSWLFHNPMTGEPHSAVFFNLEWLLIGKIGLLLHLTPPEAMNLCRVLFLVLMSFAVYWLSSFLFDSPFVRRISLVACLSGGGFGWISAVHIFHIPLDSSFFLDLTNANLFPFYWGLRLPHFLIAESFVVLGLCFFLRAERDGHCRDYLAAGFCYMAAGACRPYDMLFLMGATGLFMLLSYIQPRKSRSPIVVRAVPILISIPLLAYYYWMFKLHPIFRWWSLPGRPSPPAWLLAWGFGASFLLLPIAAWKMRRQGISDSGLFMASCFITAIVLSQMHFVFHFSFQFATNILIPMVMLVLLGLEQPILRMKPGQRWRRAAIVTTLLVNSLTSMALTGQAVVLAAQGGYDLDSQLVAAFSWINQHSQKADITLADLEIANAMPQYINSRVFCGYGSAVNAVEKLQALRDFLDSKTPELFRDNMLRQQHIQFVLLKSDQASSLTALRQSPFVREVFKNDAVTIFSVQFAK